jgi:membrane-associated protease RseP (regulator of RpoE activity)
VGDISPNIITISLAATVIAKVLVDLVRAIQNLPSWLSPILAVLFGIAAAFLLQVAAGTVLTLQMAAVSTLAGIIAGGAAVGTTELQKNVTPDLDVVAVIPAVPTDVSAVVLRKAKAKAVRALKAAAAEPKA